ncbi:CaiB/BaiF CoA transferase family protein [Filimonas effusa]|uniref:CoA transferase n=1 Tax=Filimonas effusa TaxID=2508721 RepID=A0A4Q1DBB5_9BACT|nr:CaiB/BaiF CoA-transferase family protein [Filimonas effusa]RXK86732.1 CoA transferase [Filimonas effusa]
MNQLPLQGLVVLEFSQYLSGPSAGLRLADLGARVIKIERPQGGDAGRRLAIKDLWVEEDSLLFHTINRNKESFTADLKKEEDRELVKKLILKADVLIHNFRPGVMEKIGLDYDSIQDWHPRIIYAEISGYGKEGPWKNRPGQDLLLQSVSGLAYTSGNAGDDPVPFGLSIGDTLCGAQLVQGILGALIRRHKTGKGARVEISLLESLIDFQFELVTTYHASGTLPQRSGVSNGNPLLGAPYGIYATSDGHIAIAMMNIHELGKHIGCDDLLTFDQADVFLKRDLIKQCLAAHLSQRSSAYWLALLHEHDLWAMQVFNWQQLSEQEGYRRIGMEQVITTAGGQQITTTRCPVRFNGERLTSKKAAPLLGQHTKQITEEFTK